MRTARLLIAWMVVLLLWTPLTYAWSFYVPSTNDISLLTKIETKLQKFQEEKLEILESKVKNLALKIVLSHRGAYILDTVISMVSSELVKRSEEATIAIEGDTDSKDYTKKKTLVLSEEHTHLFKSLEGYRFNRK